jgi:high-affinity nickel-transport protein
MLIFEWAEVGYHWLIGKLTGTPTNHTVHQRNYSAHSAYLVGVVHGIGAETPTQVLLFVAAAGAGGSGLGVVLVLTFIVGLLISNSIITALSTFGYIGARKNVKALMVVGGLTAVFSLTVGMFFLLGQGSLLPALLGG